MMNTSRRIHWAPLKASTRNEEVGHGGEPISSTAEPERTQRDRHVIFKSSKIVSMPFAATPLYVAKATLFRTLGHPARVRILELLRDGEHAVGALQEALDLDSGGTSQHLAALRRIGLVESRQEGTSVYYRAADPRVFALLDVGRALIARSLAEQQALLEELEAE